MLLQFRHGTIAPTIHCEQPNPHVELTDSPFFLPSAAQTWDRPTGAGSFPRRAGISSFGAGGANVHLVLEEGPLLPAPNLTPPGAAEVILLSAWTEEQLRMRAQQLLTYLEYHPELPLEDVAHTLQVGREALAERLAGLIPSREELCSRLRGAAIGNNEGWLRGQVHPKDDEGRGLELSLARLTPPEKLARLWVEGCDIPWHELAEPARGRRVSLPAYPFARERHWVSQSEVRVPSSDARGPHPLLDQVQPALDGACFIKQLLGTEFFLRDHVVRGERVLPGVLSLEAARAVAVQVLRKPTRRLSQIVWLKPLVVGPQGGSVQFRLYRGSAQLCFEVGSPLAAGEEIFARFIVPAGEEPSPQPTYFPLEEIRRGCGKGLRAAEVYARLAEQGVLYGPRFQVIESLAYGPGQVLAALHVDADTQAELHEMPWHPALLDGALQSVMGLLLAAGQPRSLAPFSVEDVSCSGSLALTRFAYIRLRESEDIDTITADVHLLDTEGRSLLAMSEVRLRAWNEPGQPKRSQARARREPDTTVPSVARMVARQVEAYRDSLLSPTVGEAKSVLPLEELGQIGLLAVFQRHGLFLRSGERHRRTTLRERFGVLPRFHPLFDALLALLETLGILLCNGEDIETTLYLDNQPLRERLRGLTIIWETWSTGHPELAPHGTLLRRCLDALPAVLTGKQSATEVFFPDGDLRLLEVALLRRSPG